jgi:hypothetical protein
MMTRPTQPKKTSIIPKNRTRSGRQSTDVSKIEWFEDEELRAFNRRETKSGWTDPESRSRTATYIVEMVGRFYAVSQRFSLEHDRRNPPESTVIEQLATVLNVCADVFHFYANRISDEIKCDFDQCGLDNNVIDGTYCAFRDVLAQHRGMEPLLQRHPRKLNG